MAHVAGKASLQQRSADAFGLYVIIVVDDNSPVVPSCRCLVQLVLVDAVKHPGAQALTYLHSKGTEARVKPASHWVVTDLNNPR